MKHAKSRADRKFNMAFAGLTLLLWALAWALPSTALAHKVNVFAWIEGDEVHTQSKFYGGKKVQNGAVQVLDDFGNLLLEGRTDDQGAFSFTAPVKTGMKIVVSAGMGHQGDWRLGPEDFSSSPDHDAGGAALSAPEEPRNRPLAAVESAAAPQRSDPGATPDEIGAIVEKALDKKLAPVLKAVSKLEERGPSLRDILGGLGYIIGLVGVAAYVAGRRKKDQLTQ